MSLETVGSNLILLSVQRYMFLLRGSHVWATAGKMKSFNLKMEAISLYKISSDDMEASVTTIKQLISMNSKSPMTSRAKKESYKQ